MKQENKYNNTALIDSDYILFIACNPNKVLDKYGKPLRKDDKYVYQDKTLEQAISTCDSYITDILNVSKADSYLFFLTAGNNFRYQVDVSYKANRTGLEKPLWFNEVRDHMKKEWSAIEVPGLEADDLVVITLNNLENSYIIAVDKDVLDCTPGKHFDARKGKLMFIETTKHYADFAFAKQLLTGDTIDGVPNLIKGMGPKTAETELSTRVEFNIISPISAAFNIYLQTLGEREGIIRFTKQYHLLKIIDSFESIPKGITFEIPEPDCWNCLETILSREEYELKYLENEINS